MRRSLAPAPQPHASPGRTCRQQRARYALHGIGLMWTASRRRRVTGFRGWCPRHVNHARPLRRAASALPSPVSVAVARMVAQPAEASVGGGEQANEKQGRKQHRGRGGHGREKRDNSVVAAAAGGTGGEAPRAVPVPPQPQLAATTTGARRRGGGQAGRATTAAVHELVAGVTSLSVECVAARASLTPGAAQLTPVLRLVAQPCGEDAPQAPPSGPLCEDLRRRQQPAQPRAACERPQGGRGHFNTAAAPQSAAPGACTCAKACV